MKDLNIKKFLESVAKNLDKTTGLYIRNADDPKCSQIAQACEAAALICAAISDAINKSLQELDLE